jgi:hypothetical protein
MGVAMDIAIWGSVAIGAVVVLIARRLYGWRQRRAQATMHQIQELRRQELLQKLTFFFSSLRHIYHKYPPEVLPPDLQAERQAFLEQDFRNLTSLSALSLAELEELFADVQRECTTGKWRGGVTAVEQRVEDGVRQLDLPHDDHVRQSEPGIPPTCPDGEGGIGVNGR